MPEPAVPHDPPDEAEPPGEPVTTEEPATPDEPDAGRGRRVWLAVREPLSWLAVIAAIAALCGGLGLLTGADERPAGPTHVRCTLGICWTSSVP
ncbi:hypothetical protein GCM10010123_24540 [Pilimelia anulata]|uniref:Uncharacterized protein n=1 Tax=Pilimelia anulata TaxID=53371 RepID=A0A8J3B4W0_9ACTN|nr:hypothetical protein [Pilimelia anulata]GGJ93791.1 hypothetical protein GCM10010123_24540 [Pilimelia anulata]